MELIFFLDAEDRAAESRSRLSVLLGGRQIAQAYKTPLHRVFQTNPPTLFKILG